MSLTTYINQLDKRYAWSLLGFVLAVLFGALSIYTEFIRDRHPQVRFEVVSDASVLDVREKLGNLEIMYDGVDIQKAKKSLRVIVFRVINEGPDDVLKGHYDEKSPLGFRVFNGSLVRAEIIGSSNNYLKESLSIRLQGQNTAVFDPVILEASESFIVKSLILYSEGTRPTIEPTGKIAGVREIKVIDSTVIAAEQSFLTQTFSGTVWTQALRLVSYFFGLIFIIALVVAPIVTVSGTLSKRPRRKHVTQFRTFTKIPLNDIDEFIFQRYITNDIDYLRILHRAVSNEGRLDYEARRYEKRKLKRGDQNDIEFMMTRTMVEDHNHRFYPSSMPIRDMQDAGFIVKSGNRWHVDPHAKETTEEFLRFLEIRHAK